MDPLVKNIMWADPSVCKAFEIELEIMILKFNVQAQHMTKINITHTKKPNAISCSSAVRYYAEKIINDETVIFVFTLAPFRDVLRA